MKILRGLFASHVLEFLITLHRRGELEIAVLRPYIIAVIASRYLATRRGVEREIQIRIFPPPLRQRVTADIELVHRRRRVHIVINGHHRPKRELLPLRLAVFARLVVVDDICP